MENTNLEENNIQEDNMQENNLKENNMIEISPILLKDIRQLIEVVNSRIHWKTSELISVGVIVKQLDDLLNNS